jgi:formylmethanofuran dehydrogenase subunit D
MIVGEQKLRLTMITGRTIDQGVGKERGKGSEYYFEHAAVCFMDAYDMSKLGIREGTNVKVTSKYGDVIVKCKEFPRGSMPGRIFMPCGLWANAICGDVTYGAGAPLFKGFPVEVEPAPDEPILRLNELLMKQYGRAA